MSYSLVPTSLGGIVTLRWRYRQRCDYYINIKIPEEYVNNDADQERLSKLIDFIVDSGIVQKVRNSVAQTKTVCSYIFKKLA